MSPDKDRRPPGSPGVIQERISARAIEALIRNYRDPQLAFLDLVDNAVDNRNRIEGKPLTIRVRVTKEELSVSNHGGKGLDFEGLDNYFNWGHSEKTSDDIGQYGVGGKAAAGFLGRGLEIVCSADGSEIEYRVSDTSWESRREGELRQYETQQQRAVNTEGYFRIRITELKHEISAAALVTKLGDIYRPLLMDGSIRITVNGREVNPMEIRYLEEEGLMPEVLRVQTRYGDWFDLKVGVLAQGQRVRPGIRCYYKGRLMEDGEFFGHPTPSQMPGSSRLIGEANLDHVPVTLNKSGLIRGVEWEMASRSIHTVLSPWMEKLANLKNLEQTKVERYEKDLARNAKRILEHALATTNIITRANLAGGSFGRLPPTPREFPEPTPIGAHKPPKKTEGATAPKLPAVGETIKRWGATHEVEPVSMGNDQTRAEIVDEDNRKKLRINSDFFLYRVAKKLGDDALEVYIAETIALEICKIAAKEKSVEDYTDMVNQLLSECGRIFNSKIADRRTARK